MRAGGTIEDGQFELTSTPSVGFTYDNNGSRTSVRNPGAGWTVSCTWDFENRLTSVSGGTGGTFNFKYDPFGRRIKMVSSTATTIYAYDGDNIVDQMGQTGTWQSRFTHGLGIDEPLEIRQQSVPLYYHADGLGSVVAVTNASRAVAASYTYNSFGQWSVQTQIVASPYGFTGREFDNANGAAAGPGHLESCLGACGSRTSAAASLPCGCQPAWTNEEDPPRHGTGFQRGVSPEPK